MSIIKNNPAMDGSASSVWAGSFAELLCAAMVRLFPTLRPMFAGNPGGDNQANAVLRTVPVLSAPP